MVHALEIQLPLAAVLTGTTRWQCCSMNSQSHWLAFWFSIVSKVPSMAAMWHCCSTNSGIPFFHQS